LTPDFLPALRPALLAIVCAQPPTSTTSKEAEKDKEKDEKDRLAKQRPVLRIVAELAMLGAWEEGPAKGVAEVEKLLSGLVSSTRNYQGGS
jgi:regulator of nonsense transcripts 2